MRAARRPIVKKLACRLLGIALLVTGITAWGQDKLVNIATYEGAPWGTEAVKTIVAEAYRRIGYSVHFDIEKPLARVGLDAQAGRHDAMLVGFAPAGERFPNLRRVEPPVGSIEFAVYSLKPVDPALAKDWQALQRSSLTIAGRHGINVLDQRLGEGRYTKVTSDAALLRMLAADRIDVLVAAAGSFDWASARDPRDLARVNAALIKLGTLERLPTYHYVDARRADLVPALSGVLEQMEKDGTMAKLWRAKAGPPPPSP